jgi:hypothetical protein
MKIELNQNEMNPSQWEVNHNGEISVQILQVGPQWITWADWNQDTTPVNTLDEAIDKASDMVLARIKTNYLAKVRASKLAPVVELPKGKPTKQERQFAIAVLDATGHYSWAGGRMRTFQTEGKAIDAAMKLARDLAKDTEHTKGVRVIVQQGPSQYLRKEIHSFPIIRDSK